MILPRPHLSFSSIDLWLKSKESFRQRYYPKTPPPQYQTIYMKYGNEITEAIKKKEKWVNFIPYLPVFEHPLLVKINGVMIKAFLDSYDPQKQAFYEYKSAMTSWSKNKINKHIQLDIYSLLLQEKYGKVKDECSLIFIETQKVEVKPVIMDGIELTGLGVAPTLKLTGKFKETERIITSEDRGKMRALIGKVAKEIEEDYKAMRHLYI